MQHAEKYAPLALRSALVPAAQVGSNLSYPLLMVGLLFSLPGLVKIGAIMFAAAVVFSIITLPVEWNASARAKRLLVDYGIVPEGDMVYVNRVLNAAAWTYVAGTLQAVLTLLYYISRFAGGRD